MYKQWSPTVHTQRAAAVHVRHSPALWCARARDGEERWRHSIREGATLSEEFWNYAQVERRRCEY